MYGLPHDDARGGVRPAISNEKYRYRAGFIVAGRAPLGVDNWISGAAEDYRVGAMLDFLNKPAAQAVIWVTVLIIITIVAVYFLLNWRDRVNKEDTTSDHLTKFRELRGRGVLKEKEFRTIKTALGEKLRDELKSDGEQS